MLSARRVCLGLPQEPQGSEGFIYFSRQGNGPHRQAVQLHFRSLQWRRCGIVFVNHQKLPSLTCGQDRRPAGLMQWAPACGCLQHLSGSKVDRSQAFLPAPMQASECGFSTARLEVSAKCDWLVAVSSCSLRA